MEPYLGEIRLFSGNFAPKGWAICAGQLLSIAQNQALFSLLGTTYGGDGRVNFALPDFRGRIPIHPGNGHVLGEKSGTQTHTMTIAEMPAHTHIAQATPMKAKSMVGGTQSGSPQNSYAGNSGSDFSYSPTKGTNESFAADALEVQVNASGGNQPFNNMMPSLSVTFIIAITGIYPSQN